MVNMWKCKICGKDTVALEKSTYYKVDKNGNPIDTITEDEEYICLNCNTSAMDIYSLADWEN